MRRHTWTRPPTSPAPSANPSRTTASRPGSTATGSARHRSRCGASRSPPSWATPGPRSRWRSGSADKRAGLLLGALTADEKISLLAGDGPFFASGHTGISNGVDRVGLPATYYSDGPVGPRQGKATAMPAPMALAATFDPRSAQRHGDVVGNEAKLKGNDVVFAPTVNIMRTPLGGRTFEGYGEDPYLTSGTGGDPTVDQDAVIQATIDANPNTVVWRSGQPRRAAERRRTWMSR